jgi:hypothetical protein
LLIPLLGDGDVVKGKPSDIELYQKYIDALRRGQREVDEQLASSREAIKHSLALLQLARKIEDEQKPFAVCFKRDRSSG